MVSAVQVWNPDDWELLCQVLLQQRHGHLNVHKIPAAHKGDYGIDYYCTKELVVYQCYAVEEPVDITVRADRQKKKITVDLRTFQKNHQEIAKLFLNIPVKHWILLVPKHDSKDVNIHCAKKTEDLRGANCPCVDPEFEVSIQDFDAFPGADVAKGLSALKSVTLSVSPPSQSELATWKAGSADLLANASGKLKKRVLPIDLEHTVSETVSSFLHGNAVLDALRSGSPELHEKVMAVVNSRGRLLAFAGPKSGGAPGQILHSEFEALLKAIKEAVPSLSTDNAEQVVYGALSDWIMRCPLDFPDGQ